MSSSKDHVSFGQPGDMPRRLNAFDWSATELGPPQEWPVELLASVNLVLDARIPMMLGWGPQLKVIYNDGYIPILGDKHPVIWEPAATAFAELWHHVGPLLDDVYRTGTAIRRDNELLPLDKHGFLEDCYFTFSYSPLRDFRGNVVGLLSTAVDTTEQVLAARRGRTLQHLAEPREPMHPWDGIRRSCEALVGSDDAPMHAVMLLGEDGHRKVVSAAGVSLDEDGIRAAGSVADVLRSDGGSGASGARRIPLTDLVGVALEESVTATHVAIAPLGHDGSREKGRDEVGVLLLGLSPSLPWDGAYQSFAQSVADALSSQHDAQRLRELVIAEAENRYRELFFEAQDGIILGKPTGQILAANPAACRIFGYSEAELIAGGRALVQDPDDPRWSVGLSERRADGSFFGELTWLHSSGRRVPSEVSSSLYADPAGGFRSTVIVRDISERLMLQAQLAEAQKMEVVGRISGGIAHDFNNLLAVIDGQTDLLRDELEDHPSALADLDLLTQTSHRAAGLIRRLLDFTRRSTEEPKALNPSIAVTEMAPILRRLVGSACELAFELDDEVPDLVMPPHQFEQVVMNLIVNARDALEEAGRAGTVEVRVRRGDAGGQVELSVADDGIGIPQSELASIFEPFYTTKQHGTGIGLNTVRLLAEGLGGAVSVDTAEGVGSTFTVTLPATTDAARVADAQAVRAPAGRLDGIQVLLVEDQAHLRTVLAKVLTRAGATVATASNGEEAIRVAEEAPPDIVVSDVVMPLLSGPELVRRLSAERSDLAIVLMSGYAGDEIVPRELLESARFLHKPFAADDLVRAVADALTPEG
ncbi:MAG: ATP-binding protein [Gemmatimonadota bacterium]